MVGKQLDPAADFHDDGGTPGFRAREQAARLSWVWQAVRFVWLFPLVGTGGLFIAALAWFAVATFVNEQMAENNWFLILAFGCTVAWERLVGKGGLGVGRLDFRGMMSSPSGGAWGLIATYFRSLFIWMYLCYATLFWLIVGIAVWAWQSGAWAHAMATMHAAGAG